jgi:WD40 repeat protein
VREAVAEKIHSLYTDSFPAKSVLAPWATWGEGGCMGRFASVVPVILLAGLISGCSHSQSVTTTTTIRVPANISLTPTPSASLELGKTLTFTGTPKDATGTAINETLSYVSSNPAVLTITTGGLACAGSWDSLTSPQLCTPGAAGVAQVTATVAGVSSPPTMVYVHQHIDNITLKAAGNQPPPVSSVCFSNGQTYNYQAVASSQGTDITSSVGPLSWASTNTSVVTLTAATPTAPVNGLLPGQAMAKANVPGVTQIYTSVGGVTGVPLTFETCPVLSIALKINGDTPGPLNVAVGNTATITPVIHDILGNLISGPFLTWTSSNPSSVAVAAGAVTTPARGGASVIASCTPPSCNIGMLPSTPIYPEGEVQFVVGPASGSTASATASTVWVSTKGCKGSDGCVSEIVSINLSGTTTTAPTVGTPVSLPATPNSMLIDRQGAKIFLGTDSGELGTKGLMVFAVSGTVNQYVSTPGKVLAVSPDGGKVIVSDTVDSPNQVFVFDTTTNTSVAYPITGATAADFSPDSLKAYIVAGSTLYVYSKLDALQKISLTATPTAVTFFPQGAFAYVAGEQANTITVRKTCDNTIANDFPSATPQVIPVPANPAFFKAVGSTFQVPSGPILANFTLLAVDPPGIDLITAHPMFPQDTAQTPPQMVPASSTTGSELAGCAPPSTQFPSGLPAIHNDVSVSSFSFGLGNFVATQLIVSSDGSTAYLLTQNSGRILVFDIHQRITSSMQLVNNAVALQAALSPDGGTLYVGASDGTVHLLETLTGNDIQQLSFPQNSSTLQSGLCSNVTFPQQTVVNISAASQNGSNTTYTYTLVSGPGLEVGSSIGIVGMGNAGDNGTFTISALGSGTFAVANNNGVTATGQNGTGSVTLACNPDLMVAKP